MPALAAYGHEITAIVGSALSPEFEPYEANGVKVIAIDRARVTSFEKRFDLYIMFPLLRRHLAAAWAAWDQARGGENFDAIETTDWGMLFVPWILRPQAPTKIQLHGSIGQIAMREECGNRSAESRLTRLFEVNCLRSAARLETSSLLNKCEWERLLNRNVSQVLPPLAVNDPAHRSDNRTDSGLVIGRIQRWKGAQELCDAMQLLGERGPTIRWIGRDTSGEEGASFSQDLAKKFPKLWGKTIIPVGAISSDLVRISIANSGFGVVPSTWDVFNIAAAEMMAASLVVLCSRGAGIAELIAEGKNGFLFESGDAESLAQCIRKFLHLTADERIRIGTAACETVSTKLNPQDVAEKHAKAFETLIENSDGSAHPLDSWTAEALAPHEKNVNEMQFLDRLPLRKLLRYLGGRVVRKMAAHR